jgi:hypothetical protein
MLSVASPLSFAMKPSTRSPSVIAIASDALRMLDHLEDDLKQAECRFLVASPPKTSVRFAASTTVTQTLSLADMTRDEIQSYWWSASEQGEIRRKALALVTSTIDRRKPFVQKTLHRALEVASSHLPTGHESEEQDRPDFSNHMKLWVFQCKALRGLEKSPLSHPKVKRIINEHRRMVLSCSERKNTTDEVVREMSRHLSTTSARFARMMALADEMMEQDTRHASQFD